MKPDGRTPKPDTREQALEARAEARRLEAAAARAQADAYDALADACEQRCRALKIVSATDLALSQLNQTEAEQERARGDGQRALDHSVLLEREAGLHRSEARRANAEAKRAESEADTSAQKAHAAELGTRDVALPTE